jgi:hypothetical protein
VRDVPKQMLLLLDQPLNAPCHVVEVVRQCMQLFAMTKGRIVFNSCCEVSVSEAARQPAQT